MTSLFPSVSDALIHLPAKSEIVKSPAAATIEERASNITAIGNLIGADNYIYMEQSVLHAGSDEKLMSKPFNFLILLGFSQLVPKIICASTDINS